nr:uncharacterized protein LOC120968072 [Aegilops tauschii subsp. strangulata]
MAASHTVSSFPHLITREDKASGREIDRVGQIHPPRPRRRWPSGWSGPANLQSKVRQRCLGLGGDWSWKRVLKLVLPCQSSTGRPSTRSGTRGRDGDNGKEDAKAARAWPAAVQLVCKLKVNRTSRRTRNGGDDGLLKNLFSTFQRQRSRPCC